MKRTTSKIKKRLNQRGVALLVAVFTFVLVSAISVELLEETQVEYISASHNIKSVKAYYAAKSGVELSLLRVLIYKKAMALGGDSLGEKAAILNKIWSFPFMWPPQLPENATLVDKDLLKSAMEETLIDSTFATQISSEGSKIDINALASKSKTLSENTKKLIMSLFQNKIEQDDNFARQYQLSDVEEVVNHIIDWMDEDQESLNGGDEGNYYRAPELRDYPPNQPFKTLEELHMVEGMTDDIFEVLAPNITVYGTVGINVNEASKDVLMTIDPGIDEEIADEIIKHRSDEENGGPFPKLEEFLSFLQTQGLTLDQEKLKKEGIPLHFSEALNFRVVSTANVGQTSREIVAIVYDFDRVKERLAKHIKENDKEENDDNSEDSDEESNSKAEQCKDKEGDEKYQCLCEGKSGDDLSDCIESEKEKDQGKQEEENKKAEPPKGRPDVVYWFEK